MGTRKVPVPVRNSYIRRLVSNNTFVQKLVKAICEALQYRSSMIRFKCRSGRHRSVAAVHVTQYVLRGMIGEGNITTRHALRHHWQNICHLQRNECYHFFTSHLRHFSAQLRRSSVTCCRHFGNTRPPAMVEAPGFTRSDRGNA